MCVRGDGRFVGGIMLSAIYVCVCVQGDFQTRMRAQLLSTCVCICVRVCGDKKDYEEENTKR